MLNKGQRERESESERGMERVNEMEKDLQSNSKIGRPRGALRGEKKGCDS